MALAEKKKDPGAKLDYQMDWSRWLSPAETIETSEWSVEPTPGLTIESESHTSTTATVWLSGGTARKTYTVTNRIVTNAGREDERSFTLEAVDR